MFSKFFFFLKFERTRGMEGMNGRFGKVRLIGIEKANMNYVRRSEG